MRQRRESKAIVFGPSQAIPGQALKPADLLKRHLAGTLPDIDESGKFEYHYNENGEQIAEPMPLELHEIYRLSHEIREKQKEAAIEARKKQAEKHKADIIAAYVAEQAAKKALEDQKLPPATPAQE